jgi:hypothetical protein
MGLCGPLTPTRCEFTERRNGLSQLVLEHPIDEAGRWSQLIPRVLVKADVPVRTPPEVTGDGALVTTVEKWLVKTIATKGQRKLYSKCEGGRVIKVLPVWADKEKTERFAVTVVQKGENRYKARTRYGTGWVAVSAIEHSVSYTIDDDPTAIETVEPAVRARPQLFRIREVVVTNRGVTATASHLFYDLAGNVTTWSGYDATAKENNPTCLAALAGILQNCAVPHEFVGHTNLLDRRVDASWTRAGAVDALLAPDTGLADRWGLELIRDDYDFYLLRVAGLNRGVAIEYGKNLLGVAFTTDTTDIVTRVLPVGRSHKDKELLLAPGSYEVNGQAVVVADGQPWVTSPFVGDFPAPGIRVLETGVKAAGGSASDILTARRRMIEAALRVFSDEEADRPKVSLRVDFVRLGDTMEYEQFKNLDNVFLCDRVRVRHQGIGLDVLTEVVEVAWDCLKGRYKSIELGSVVLDRTRATLPVWQLPVGIPGTLISVGTVGASALQDGVGSLIDLSENASVRAMYVTVESSAGSVLKGASAETTLTARVYRGVAEITNELNAALFSWCRASGNAEADAIWAAARAGVKSITVNAAEIIENPAVYHCDVADPA